MTKDLEGGALQVYKKRKKARRKCSGAIPMVGEHNQTPARGWERWQHLYKYKYKPGNYIIRIALSHLKTIFVFITGTKV